MFKENITKFKPTLEGIISGSDLRTKWKKHEEKDYLCLVNNQSYIKFKKFKYPNTVVFEQESKTKIMYVFSPADDFTIQILKDKVKIYTPTLGDIQLYYFNNGEKLYFSNSFAKLVLLIKKSESLVFDELGVHQYLSYNFDTINNTIFKNIKRLQENRTLDWKQGRYRIKVRTEIKNLLTIYTNINDENYINIFEAEFNKVYDNVLSSSKQPLWGSTFSSGVDSTISTIFASRYLPTYPAGILSGIEKIRSRQLKVASEVNTLFNNKLRWFEPLLHLFKHNLSPVQNTLLYDPYLSSFSSWNLVLIDYFAKLGIKIVWNGLGGDDYYNHNKEVRLKDKTNTILKLNEDVYTKESTNLPSGSIVSKVQSNGLSFYNNTWYDLGITPISPFISRGSISLSLHLNKTQKVTKKFLRAYVENLLPKKKIPQWRTKDDMSVYIKTRAFENLDLIKNSPILNCNNINKLVRSEKIHKIDEKTTLNYSEVGTLNSIYKLTKFIETLG